MSAGATTGRRELARVTVVGPDRRLDVAVPTDLALCDLLPGLVARLGDGLGDDGESHGGWRVRTDTGDTLEQERTLAQQQVRDGQRLHLVPGDADWPEVDYDDVVEAIAQSGRDAARSWSPRTTRTAGMVAACAVVLLGLVVVLSAPLAHPVAGGLVVGTGLVLLLCGVVAARPLSDSGAGALLALLGVGQVALAAGFATSPPGTTVWQVDGGDLLLASVTLVLGCALAHVGVGAWTRVWTGGVVVGTGGLLMAVLCVYGLAPTAGAAAALSLATAMLAVFPLLAMRLGRVPVPALPRTPEELLTDPPRPDAARVRSAVLRADELLTGFLGGTAVVVVLGQLVLMVDGDGAAVALALVVGATFGLRAQLFPATRHRAPLLVVAAVSALAVVAATATAAPGVAGLVVLCIVAVVVALLALAGTAHGRGVQLSPYVLRAVDLVEVVLLVSILPLAASVVGLYAFARGLAG